MKLLFENWREYLAEAAAKELKQDLIAFVQNNDLDKEDIEQILAGEEVLNEAIGQDLANLYRKYGKQVIAGGLAGMIGMGAAAAHHPGSYETPDFSGPQITQMQQADTSIQANSVFLDKINAALNKVFTSLKEKVPVDIRMGAKFLAGGESKTTNKDFTQAELDFLSDMVSQKTEGGQKNVVVLDYNDWDKAAKGVYTTGGDSSLYNLDNPDFLVANEKTCDIEIAKATGKALPALCYAQEKADSIVSGDIAVQMKRVWGAVKVTKIDDGKYEFTDYYDFNKGQSGGVMEELIELVKDLTNTHNDQKAYTAMRRLFQMRGAGEYKGYPIQVTVDIGVANT